MRKREELRRKEEGEVWKSEGHVGVVEELEQGK